MNKTPDKTKTTWNDCKEYHGHCSVGKFP